MLTSDYEAMFTPHVKRAARFLKDMERRHGSGITLSPQDAVKAARHALLWDKGDINPDGESHALATFINGFKMLEAESADD